MTTTDNQPRTTYFRIALQSALAAGLCLGLPAGLLLWLILIRHTFPASPVGGLVAVLQAHGLNQIFVLAICSLGWSYFLSRISGYRPWWKIGIATALGILAGWFSPLSNLDGLFGDRMPIPALYIVAMCGIVAGATLCVGLAYGVLLRNVKAALTISLTTSFASVIALLLTIWIFDQFGIYVGGNVPFAMSKVTTTSLLVSAIAGGAVLGVGFCWFVDESRGRVTPPLLNPP
jgi:hypothetical protein